MNKHHTTASLSRAQESYFAFRRLILFIFEKSDDFGKGDPTGGGAASHLYTYSDCRKSTLAVY